MKNWERYEEELKAIGTAFSVNKVTGKVVSCFFGKDKASCGICKFSEKNAPRCNRKRIEWLYSEYSDKPKLTKRERLFCELVGYGWISRDSYDYVLWYGKEPTMLDNTDDEVDYLGLSDILDLKFGFIGPNDVWTVEDLLKLEVQDE